VSALLVERPGLLSTVQDRGREGWQHLGVPVSGWMDDWSARLANRLVGNPDTHAVVEVTWAGPTLVCDGALSLAVTGAVFDVLVDGRRLRTPLTCTVAAGGRIEFGQRHRGARAYVAVAGGVDVPPALGSRATDVRSALGGLDGRRLGRGDRLAIGPAEPREAATVELPAPEWVGCAQLRVTSVEGYGAQPLEDLCHAGYRLAAASDRTGYRLMAERPLLDAPGTLISQPVVMGAVQVPPDGSPLLLMADRQTTGGYAVPAVVIAADLPVAGQLGPGDECRFLACTIESAREAAAVRERALDLLAGPSA
jgi:biotin-dependent carboxylase-like uncharacterized protein